MMDGVDQILQDFEKTVAAASAEAISRLRAISARHRVAPIAAVAPNGEPDRRRLRLVPVGEAARLSGLSKSHVRTLCGEHLFGSSPGGFGYKRGGRWEVAADLFLEFRRSARVSGV